MPLACKKFETDCCKSREAEVARWMECDTSPVPQGSKRGAWVFGAGPDSLVEM
jgi:hypothetical protein